MTEIFQPTSWSYIKNRLKTEGAENKLYDADINGKIDDADSVDGYHIVGDAGWCFE